jgi:anaerobic ribonucleoside-triphosphate reductase activating protein
MPEITIIVDSLRGAILVEDNQDLSAQAVAHLRASLGNARGTGCARPLEVITPPALSSEEVADDTCVRIAGYYHDSLTEGPGRRSSVLFQFCPLKCKGCWVPELHSAIAGSLISVAKLAELLLDPNFERDGVSILGGEPFAQAPGLLLLVERLRAKGCRHILCYSGYTLEVLREKSAREPAIGGVLDEIDVLIDGAYVESLAAGAEPWTGSGNQRVIDLAATRRVGRIILFQ